MGGDGNGPVRGLPIMIGLGIALAVAAILALSGWLVPKATVPAAPPTAENSEPPNVEAATEARAREREREREEAERQDALRRQDELIAAEKEAQARRAEEQRMAAQAARAEDERKAAEAERLELAAVAREKARREAEQNAARAAAERHAAEAEAAWGVAQQAGADGLKSYLQRYPDGAHIAEAQAALDGMARRTTRSLSGSQLREVSAPTNLDPPPSGGLLAWSGGSPNARGYALGDPTPRTRRSMRAPSGAKPQQEPGPSTPDARAIVKSLTPPQGGARLTRSLTSTPASTPSNERPNPGAAAPPASGAAAPSPAMPLFPRQPPRASARYQIPDQVFAAMKTYGEATKFILAALETGGYVERSFFSTEAGGVAMVTRLERINDDGTPAPAAARWALKLPPDGAVSEAIAFLRGLFFIEPGHYRTIVFILQDQPFAQDDKPASEPQARAWISRGANIISPDVGQKSYAGAHCTALIYEFASDGASVKLVDGGLTGKEHLARSGLLAALEPAR